MFTRKSVTSGGTDPAVTPLQRHTGQTDKTYVMDAVNSDGVVVIGKGTRINGHITDVRRLEIQGSVEGKIIADVVIVRDSGIVKGELRAEQAEIHGRFEGQLQVTGVLDVRSTGRVEGELAYGRLAVAMGGHIAGNVNSETPDARLSEIQVPDDTHPSIPTDPARINGYTNH